MHLHVPAVQAHCAHKSCWRMTAACCCSTGLTFHSPKETLVLLCNKAVLKGLLGTMWLKWKRVTLAHHTAPLRTEVCLWKQFSASVKRFRILIPPLGRANYLLISLRILPINYYSSRKCIPQDICSNILDSKILMRCSQKSSVCRVHQLPPQL